MNTVCFATTGYEPIQRLSWLIPFKDSITEVLLALIFAFVIISVTWIINTTIRLEEAKPRYCEPDFDEDDE